MPPSINKRIVQCDQLTKKQHVYGSISGEIDDNFKDWGRADCGEIISPEDYQAVAH